MYRHFIDHFIDLAGAKAMKAQRRNWSMVDVV